MDEEGKLDLHAQNLPISDKIKFAYKSLCTQKRTTRQQWQWQEEIKGPELGWCNRLRQLQQKIAYAEARLRE